jgi:hypothetical protein
MSRADTSNENGENNKREEKKWMLRENQESKRKRKNSSKDLTYDAKEITKRKDTK